MALAYISLACGLLLACPAYAQQAPRSPAPSRSGSPPAAAPQPTEPPPAIYEPQIMKLAEILGALTYLTEICRPDGQPPNAETEGDIWRKRMRELIEAEAQTQGQKDRYAGAFNRGVSGYKVTYRNCTPSGQAAVEGLLKEGARTAQELSNRFGS